MDMQKSKDKDRKGKSSMSVDKAAIGDTILEKIEKIGEELLK